METAKQKLDKFYEHRPIADRVYSEVLIIEAMESYARQMSQQTGTNTVVSGSVLPTEDELKVRLDELPYTKHLDDGQYNDGQAYGFECGARWVMDYVKGKTDR